MEEVSSDIIKQIVYKPCVGYLVAKTSVSREFIPEMQYFHGLNCNISKYLLIQKSNEEQEILEYNVLLLKTFVIYSIVWLAYKAIITISKL